MQFKLFILFTFVLAARAGTLLHHPTVYSTAPIIKAAVPVSYTQTPIAVEHNRPVFNKADEEYDPHPQYKFSYNVQDSLSGDTKSQTEERDGDAVRGEYSLIEADGFRRIVQYTSDPVNGFNAIVNRVPLDGAPVKAVYAAPPSHQPTHIIQH